MLVSLHIRDFVIVDQADINFTEGFTVFSGETGAGKSILIDALALSLGQRSEPHYIREGADKTTISAVFETNQATREWLQAQELDDSELVLRRVIDRAGKSKAFINGSPATLTQLREVAEFLIDIHGQHAHQLLLKPSAQRQMLDAHGKHQEHVKQVATSWKTWQAALQTYQQASMNREQQELVRQRLEWQLDELNALKPAKDEWETINTEYNRLAHASSLLEGAAQTLNRLDNDEQSLSTELSHACATIASLMQKDPALSTIYETLESARIACVEAASDLASYLDKVELDPERLEHVEQRMRALFDAANKFKVEPEQLYALRTSLNQELEQLNQSIDLAALQAKVDTAQAEYDEHARELSKVRAKTARALGQAVTEAMQTLAMQGGSFTIELQDSPASAQGLETIVFNVAGHAGSTPRPLAKVASGGELARISLALSVMANQASQVPTLIFDEVDTGVGGAVAEVVGKLLRALGQRHQVLCVTHLPQVAACAHQHFEVSKQLNDGVTTSQISLLSEGERIQEIARMLGGMKITETTRQHAQEMLAHQD